MYDYECWTTIKDRESLSSNRYSYEISAVGILEAVNITLVRLTEDGLYQDGYITINAIRHDENGYQQVIITSPFEYPLR
jgi:hypothetical protein